MWQDSLLSVCFDRPPLTTPARLEVQLSGRLSYTDAMYALCDRTLRIIGVRVHRDKRNFSIILEDVAKIEEIRRQSLGSPHGVPHTLGIRQRTESCALNLHISFIIAWLCRPVLQNHHSPESRTGVQLRLREICNKNLIECIRAFVQLHSLSTLASRSWAVIHNGLSSALLLSLLGQTATNSQVQKLQGQIIHILSTEPNDRGGQGKDVHNNIELSLAHTRAVAALRSLYNDQSNNSAQNSAAGNGGPNQEASENQFHRALNTTVPLQ